MRRKVGLISIDFKLDHRGFQHSLSLHPGHWQPLGHLPLFSRCYQRRNTRAPLSPGKAIIHSVLSYADSSFPWGSHITVFSLLAVNCFLGVRVGVLTETNCSCFFTASSESSSESRISLRS